MEDTKYVWAWVVGVVGIIIIILGFWWWGSAHPSTSQEVGYAGSTTDALVSPNAAAPTAPVVVEPAAEATGSTVADIVASLGNESRFAAMLSATGVSSELTGAGPYTLFVPSNAGFSLLPPGALDLTAAQEKRLVEYHIVAGREVDIDAQPSGTIEALSTDMLNFSKSQDDQSARVNSAVALQEYKASNGVVYVISEVLLPPVNQQNQG